MGLDSRRERRHDARRKRCNGASGCHGWERNAERTPLAVARWRLAIRDAVAVLRRAPHVVEERVGDRQPAPSPREQQREAERIEASQPGITHTQL